jgi:hypothetical protein
MSNRDDAIAAEYNRLRGRLCGIVESWGLPNLFEEEGARQERGMISTLKSLTYDSEAVMKQLVQDEVQDEGPAR